MIEAVIERWHNYLTGALPGGLDELLDDDVVFYSPILYTPQSGKELTKLYLTAARSMLLGDTGPGSPDGRFRYTKQVLAGDTAVLEFETSVDDTYVNGVDIICINEAARIVEFRVMIRTLRAVNIVHQGMKDTLEALQGDT